MAGDVEVDVVMSLGDLGRRAQENVEPFVGIDPGASDNATPAVCRNPGTFPYRGFVDAQRRDPVRKDPDLLCEAVQDGHLRRRRARDHEDAVRKSRTETSERTNAIRTVQVPYDR